MPELRKDPIVGRWVIIAHERAKRPHDFKGEAQRWPRSGVCPFCEGHEDKTPPEILAYRDRGTRPTGRAGASASCPTGSPRCKIEGESQQARRGHLRQDGRHRRPRGHHRDAPATTSAWPSSPRTTSAKSSGSTATGSSTSRRTRASSTACSSRTSAPPAAPAWSTPTASSSSRRSCRSRSGKR